MYRLLLLRVLLMLAATNFGMSTADPFSSWKRLYKSLVNQKYFSSKVAGDEGGSVMSGPPSSAVADSHLAEGYPTIVDNQAMGDDDNDGDDDEQVADLSSVCNDGNQLLTLQTLTRDVLSLLAGGEKLTNIFGAVIAASHIYREKPTRTGKSSKRRQLRQIWRELVSPLDELLLARGSGRSKVKTRKLEVNNKQWPSPTTNDVTPSDNHLLSAKLTGPDSNEGPVILTSVVADGTRAQRRVNKPQEIGSISEATAAGSNSLNHSPPDGSERRLNQFNSDGPTRGDAPFYVPYRTDGGRNTNKSPIHVTSGLTKTIAALPASSAETDALLEMAERHGKKLTPDDARTLLTYITLTSAQHPSQSPLERADAIIQNLSARRSFTSSEADMIQDFRHGIFRSPALESAHSTDTASAIPEVNEREFGDVTFHQSRSFPAPPPGHQTNSQFGTDDTRGQQTDNRLSAPPGHSSAQFPHRVDIDVIFGEIGNVPSTREQVAFVPDMGVFDAIYEADAGLEVHKDGSLDCYVISKAVSVPVDETHNWQITITDATHEILSVGPCISSRRQLKLRPGYEIILDYVTKL